MVQGTGKADWQEVFSDGTDSPAQAGTREEVVNKKDPMPKASSMPAAGCQNQISV